MTSLKIWLFISIMCFVTYEIHVSAAAMKTSVKKPALSSSSKSGICRRLLVCSPKERSLGLETLSRDDWETNILGHIVTRILFCNPPRGKIQLELVLSEEVIDADVSIKYGDELDLDVVKYDKKLIRSNWIQLEPQSCEYFTITGLSKNPSRSFDIIVKCEEPRRVTTLLMKTVTKDYQTSELVSIANEMNSDEFMGVTDKKSKKYLFAQQMRMDFLNRLETRLLDDIRDVRSEDIMGADSDKLLNEIMDAYSVFSKFRPVPNAKILKEFSIYAKAMIFKFKDLQSMWTLYTALDSHREFFDLPTKSQIIAHVIDRIIAYNDDKQQMEFFKYHFDFLTSDRFSKREQVLSIGFLKSRIQRCQEVVARKYLDVITEYELNVNMARDYDELILKYKGLEEQLINESRKSQQLQLQKERLLSENSEIQ
eukprot:885647_1